MPCTTPTATIFFVMNAVGSRYGNAGPAALLGGSSRREHAYIPSSFARLRKSHMINQSGSRTQSLRALLTLLAIAVFVGTLPAKDAFPVGTYASDDFTIAFRGDGTFRVSEKGDAVVEGSYTVEADRITLTDKQGRYACPADVDGKYTWKQNGQTLAFTSSITSKFDSAFYLIVSPRPGILSARLM